MRNQNVCGTISAEKNEWIFCPVCRKGKLLKIRPETVVLRLDVKCKLCGTISEVNKHAPEPASDETSA